MIAKQPLNLSEKLVFLIILLIGFQQFPILRVGGSFKIYELLSLLLLGYVSVFGPYSIKLNKATIYSILFFVISPIISYGYFYIVKSYPTGFYRYYPLEDSFKYNFYIFPTLQLIYMFFNCAVINFLSNRRNFYFYLESVIKYSIAIGTIIAIYSLFSMFVHDFVLDLPSFIQNKTRYDYRSSGFSQEPSFYVLYQAWICLFVLYSKKLINKLIWPFLLFINMSSLIFTFSTTLIGLVLLLILSLFFLKRSVKGKLFIFIIIILLIGTTFGAIIYFDLTDIFAYYFITKVETFISAPAHTLDSGSFRRYTSAIGLQIFKDNPITGVGIGNSIYYMYQYEFKMGIETFGQTLQAGSFPQNIFSLVLSEQGAIGGIFLFLFLLEIFLKNWKNRNKSVYHQMFFIGTMFNVIAMFSIAPVYSLFLWVFIALGLNYIKFYNLDTASDKSSLLSMPN